MFSFREHIFFLAFLLFLSAIITSWAVLAILILGDRIDFDVRAARVAFLIEVCLFAGLAGSSKLCHRVIAYHRALL